MEVRDPKMEEFGHVLSFFLLLPSLHVLCDAGTFGLFKVGTHCLAQVIGIGK